MRATNHWSITQTNKKGLSKISHKRIMETYFDVKSCKVREKNHEQLICTSLTTSKYSATYFLMSWDFFRFQLHFFKMMRQNYQNRNNALEFSRRPASITGVYSSNVIYQWIRAYSQAKKLSLVSGLHRVTLFRDWSFACLQVQWRFLNMRGESSRCT